MVAGWITDAVLVRLYKARQWIGPILALILIGLSSQTRADQGGTDQITVDQSLGRFVETQKQIEVKQVPAELGGNGVTLKQVTSLSAVELVHSMGASFPFSVELRTLNRAEPSPYMAVTTAGGNCVLIKNTSLDEYPGWTMFLNAGGLDAGSGTLFAVLHELGHCVNKLTPSHVYGVAQPGIESETYADLFAFAWLSKILPYSEFEKLAQGVISARSKQSGFFSRSHSTASTLKAALALAALPVPTKTPDILAASNLPLDNNFRIE